MDCPHIGCDYNFLRYNLTTHVENCLHRLIPCEFCNVRKKVDVLDAHVLTCPKRPVPCPNSCKNCSTGEIQYFRPSEITQHRTVCGMESIDGNCAMAGCKRKHIRKLMPLHENDINVHFSLLFDALQTAQAEVIELNQFKVTAQAQMNQKMMDIRFLLRM